MQQLYKNEARISFFENNYAALKESDALLIVTEWDAFRMSDFEKIKHLMSGNIIIDGRNIWNKKELTELGFIYEGI